MGKRPCVPSRATAGPKKNLCATSCLLIANSAPDLLLNYLHGLTINRVLFQHS
jgi:hypothetical protein